MIDFVKIWVEVSATEINRIRTEIGLHFEEVKTKRSSYLWSRLQNLEIRIFDNSNKLEVSGSLHKYFNDGQHNANDYTRLDLYDTIAELCSYFQIEPQRMSLHGFEFGVNIQIAQSVESVLNRVLYKGNVEIEPMEEAIGLNLKGSIARLKMYKKIPPQQPKNERLRIEMHIDKMQYFKTNNVEVCTLADLQRIDIIERLGQLLLKELEEVVFIEEIPYHHLTKKESIFLDNVCTRTAWQSLTRKQRFDQLNKYRALVGKYIATNTLSHYLHHEVKNKWDCLLLLPPQAQNRNVFTTWEEEEKEEENTKTVMFLPLEIKGKNVTSNKKRKSFVCGSKLKLDVLMVRRCSNCREWMAENKKYCSDHCKQQHDHRNRKSNPPHALKRKLQKSLSNGGGLFSVAETIHLTHEQVSLLNYFNKDGRGRQNR